MLVRYWQTAIISAILTLLGNVVWAQTTPGDGPLGLRPRICKQGNCYYVQFSCTKGECCKDGKCCKDGECCCKSQKCDEKCTCCKDNKCECGKDSECCCSKSGKCCCNDKTSEVKTGCCPFMSKLAKRAAIIMVMPAPIPMFGETHVEAMRMLPHPPMPVPPHVVMPAPLPPPMLTPPGIPVPTLGSPIMPPQSVAFPVSPAVCCPCPTVTAETVIPGPKTNTSVETCVQLMGLASDLCSIARTPSVPSLCASALGLISDLCPTICAPASPSYVTHPPQYIPPSPPFPTSREFYTQEAAVANPSACGIGCSCGAVGQPIVVGTPCSCAAPMTSAKIQITAISSSDEVEMKVGCDTCIRCKKMTIKIGENEIAVSRFDDRVRVRGEELKATAAHVRSDGKDQLILEGDVMLHYRKGMNSANVNGDRIELNLCSGAVTIKSATKSSSTSSVSIGKE
jgi:hypothetical protein